MRNRGNVMSSASPGERSVEALEIVDVFLVSSTCTIARDFNPQEQIPANVASAHRIRSEETVLHQVRVVLDAEKTKINVIRYFINAEVHVGKPGVEFPDGNLSDDDALSRMVFVFAADYRVESVPDAEMLSAFGKNAVFHVWPYWREAVHSACAKLRLPPITIPMLKPNGNPVVIMPGQTTGAGSDIPKTPAI